MTPQSLISANALNELKQEAFDTPAGCFVEVGVYKGGSAAVLADVARVQARSLWLFDTFTGIPHADPGCDVHKVGDFGDASLEEVKRAIPDAVCIAGIFPGTLPDDLPPVAFAHLDCDQFESVHAAALALEPYMVSGGVMVFDDYDVLPGARLAVEELFAGRIEISAQGKARVRF
jgi:hypothetical protein